MFLCFFLFSSLWNFIYKTRIIDVNVWFKEKDNRLDCFLSLKRRNRTHKLVEILYNWKVSQNEIYFPLINFISNSIYYSSNHTYKEGYLFCIVQNCGYTYKEECLSLG